MEGPIQTGEYELPDGTRVRIVRSSLGRWEFWVHGAGLVRVGALTRELWSTLARVGVHAAAAGEAAAVGASPLDGGAADSPSR